MRVVDQLEDLLSRQGKNVAIERPSSSWSAEHAVWRLWQAKRDHPSAIQDHAILVRQCIRWLGNGRVRAIDLPGALQEALATVGVSRSAAGYLIASPYHPDWICESTDGECMDDPPKLASLEESFDAEEWLTRLTGKTRWRSSAQKEACWKAVTAAPGSTTLIGLPTGAGKSLVFQAVAALSPGLTVVVVPTVALGIDQLEVAKALPSAAFLNPQTYDSDGDAVAVREMVANRSCRLVFSSPEACVSGRLRAVIDDHAASGWLSTVVVDEAHIVESWGADFRIEFQLLGGLVRNWRAKTNQQCRTVLLSATFASSTVQMLKRIFTEPTDLWSEYVVQRLRPEIHYFMRGASEEQQVEWITEAIRFTPRPLILYVTEREQANWWRDHLQRELNLIRLEAFHGDTRKDERRRIMGSWRKDQLDVVVATSAFGMGVDKPDVRTVLHACFPETIDRFYQEVGRGGRDGASTLSLMIYTSRDKEVARGLAPTLLRPDTINRRWRALWETRQVIADGQFRVRTDARQADFIGVRTYQENVRWNKRLLQMLHRARVLNVTDLVSERSSVDGAEYIEWAHISNIQLPPLDPNPGDKIRDVRDEELDVIDRGYRSLERCASGEPICKELKSYYGPDVVRACGSCRSCRLDGEPPRTPSALEWPEESASTKPRVLIVPMDRPVNNASRTKWILALRQVINNGWAQRFVAHSEDKETVDNMLREALGLSAVPSPYRLDVFQGLSIPVIDPYEQTIVLHPNNFHEEMKVFNGYGRVCSHLMARDQIEDHFGRWRFTQDNARPIDDVSTWLTQQ